MCCAQSDIKTNDYYRMKQSRSYLRDPYFIEFSDLIGGNPPPPPKTLFHRIMQYDRARRELLTGMLYATYGNKEMREQSDASIWICGYCRVTNFEFHRAKRRFSDIIRYYRYNDALSPEFGFLDSDLQFLEHSDPPLCDNCFRYRFWCKRHEVIEVALAFYIYYFASFACFGFPSILSSIITMVSAPRIQQLSVTE